MIGNFHAGSLPEARLTGEMEPAPGPQPELPPSLRQEIPWLAVSLLVAGLWACWLTWPLLPRLQEGLLGTTSAAWSQAWLVARAGEPAPGGAAPQRLLSFPEGLSSWDWRAWGSVVLALPAARLGGPVVAVNLATLANVTLSIWCLALLVRLVGAPRSIALLVACLAAAHPWYRLDLVRGETGHLGWQWLCLYLAALIGVGTGRLSPLLLLGAGALAAWTSREMGLMVMAAGVLSLLLPLRVDLRWRARLHLPVLLGLVLFLGVWSLPPGPQPQAAPSSFPRAACQPGFQARTGNWLEGRTSLASLTESDVPGLAAQQAIQGSLRLEASPDPSCLSGRDGLTTLMALAAVGAVLAFPGRWLFLVLALLGLLLSLGPYLFLPQHCRPLPWGVEWLSLLTAGGMLPYRFLALSVIAAAVFAAQALGRALEGALSPLRVLLVGLLLALAATEVYLDSSMGRETLHLAAAQIPSGYAWLKTDQARPGALIEWPVHPTGVGNAGCLLAQIVHGRPLLNSPFQGPEELARLGSLARGNRLLEALLEPAGNVRLQSLEPAEVEGLARQGFAYIVLHRRVVVPESRSKELETLLYRAALPRFLEECLGPPVRQGELEFYPLVGRSRGSGRAPRLLSVPLPRSFDSRKIVEYAFGPRAAPTYFIQELDLPLEGRGRLTFWYSCTFRPGASGPPPFLGLAVGGADGRRLAGSVYLEGTEGAWVRVEVPLSGLRAGRALLMLRRPYGWGEIELRLVHPELEGLEGLDR